MHILTTSQAIDFPRLFFRFMTTDPVVLSYRRIQDFPSTCLRHAAATIETKSDEKTYLISTSQSIL